MDAARLLPFLGAMLFAVPLLWSVPDPTGAQPDDGVRMSEAILYIFGTWSVLIVTIALFGLSTRLWTGNDSPDGPGQE